MYNAQDATELSPAIHRRNECRMAQRISEELTGIKNTLSQRDLDESATKQGVVLRLLSMAGWDVFNISEVKPEHTVGGRRVDYALKPDSSNAVFIEVKRNGENLEGHQQQLLEYCFQQGVKLAALTNGRTWWLYLPLQTGSWEQRRFLTIDVESQDPEVVEQRFIDHLSEEKVTSGEAISNAEDLVRSRQRTEITGKAIIEAWKQIVETPDEKLVDLVAETAERICGFKPETERIQEFLSEKARNLVISQDRSEGQQRRPTPPITPPNPRPAGPSIQEPQEIHGKNQKPTSFRFQDENRTANSWNDILIQLCGILSELRPHDFDRVLSIRRSERASARWPYHFSKSSEDLRKPKAIPHSDIYAEVDLDATTIVRLAYTLVEHFDYTKIH